MIETVQIISSCPADVDPTLCSQITEVVRDVAGVKAGLWELLNAVNGLAMFKLIDEIKDVAKSAGSSNRELIAEVSSAYRGRALGTLFVVWCGAVRTFGDVYLRYLGILDAAGP